MTVGLSDAVREALRVARVSFQHGREREALERLQSQPPRLQAELAVVSPEALLHHFRNRAPRFFLGFENPGLTAQLQKKLFPAETGQLLEWAELNLRASSWPWLASVDAGNWRKDPFSGRVWPLDYHADISLQTADGSDIRRVWEVNRLGYFIALSRAYAITGKEDYAVKILTQFDSWLEQNPLGRGPNWSCAMEVALRAMNLLGVFTICLHAENFTPQHLSRWLQSFEQHGAHIKRNLEFSYLGTTNHYLTDVVGLLWLGLTLPELVLATTWREWAAKELFNEMNKQVLPDGADYEGTTGYHRYALELFLYSFILCRQHEIEIDQEHWKKLHSMLGFLKCYLRPDTTAPLIGDTDGSQVLPITTRRADDHAYLLPIGAAVTGDPTLKCGPPSEELLWVCGEAGLKTFESLPHATASIESKEFSQIGMYVLRKDDLFMLFNAARHLRAGRSSHRHNDALSIEVAACGCPFIVDPGSYVYSADLAARHQFRSTAYHSTVQLDDAEQNTIKESEPFVFGNDARPKVTSWHSSEVEDRLTGTHVGYERLAGKVRHERTVTFHKRNRWWLVEDKLLGSGTHKVSSRFHLADGLHVIVTGALVTAMDPESGARLIINALDDPSVATGNTDRWVPALESQFVSYEYGSRQPSTTVVWTSSLIFPCHLRWAIVPVCAGDDKQERLRVLEQFCDGVN